MKFIYKYSVLLGLLGSLFMIECQKPPKPAVVFEPPKPSVVFDKDKMQLTIQRKLVCKKGKTVHGEKTYTTYTAYLVDTSANTANISSKDVCGVAVIPQYQCADIYIRYPNTMPTYVVACTSGISRPARLVEVYDPKEPGYYIGMAEFPEGTTGLMQRKALYINLTR